MRHVRCLFFVQHVVIHNALPGAPRLLSARVGPTYSKRDGEVVAEHRAFWEATPSGTGEIQVPEDSKMAALLQPGGYFYLDLYDHEPPVHPSHGEALRTDWLIEAVHVQAAAFKPRLIPAEGHHLDRDRGRENGRNHVMFRNQWRRDTFLEFSVTNCDAFPFFELRPQPLGKSRAIVIDFSPA